MTSAAHERIEAAIRLEKPDRVPVVPMIDMFASRYGGITQHELFFDIRKADEALEKTMDSLGVVDGYHLTYAGLGRYMLLMFPSTPKLPGVGGVPADAGWQYVEKSVMEPSEYGDIVELGAEKWLYGKLKECDPRLRNRVTFARQQLEVFADMRRIRRSVRSWGRKGVVSMVAANLAFTPMEFMSLACRSFNDFTLDLFRYPEDVKAACRASLETLWKVAMRNVRDERGQTRLHGRHQDERFGHQPEAVRGVRASGMAGVMRVLRGTGRHPGPALRQRLDTFFSLLQGFPGAESAC